MIEYKRGDILKENVDALVNTVNCVGVMGRGIALQFKNAFPENFKAYVRACKAKEVVPGQMFVHKIEEMHSPHYIINFPTKRHWRGSSKMEDIESGLEALASIIQKLGIKSIAIPPLGSGLGGLDWEQVKLRIEKAMAPLKNVHIVLFDPAGAPVTEKMSHSRKAPNMTHGRAALICLMQRYLSGLLDPYISLLEVHKLMYFMQEAGEPLNLTFKKALYGPYAEELRHVLHHLEGHYLSGYADGGDSPSKELSILPGALQDAEVFIKDYEDTVNRFEKVADLVEGFESSFGLELLSTVFWLVKDQPFIADDELVKEVYSWNKRKQQFSPRQIQVARKVLESKGWVH